ncbi:regulator of arylsulfatase activity [uncultured delta proteobacterium]|uniref:Regulator of arylsulfatase activity n=1 Tax=uncultured delta proteobacterium TaxID=34034 RepID=A0A212KFD0_9DELT|nr:regulator of arylsulfatase activity [uncultured delta proteobacterium]
MPQQSATRAFHAMAKPGGARCNLRCAYCFYLEKSALHAPPSPAMSDEVLEAYVRGYIGSIRDDGEVAFTWQGGEPTLAGQDFYRRAVALQQRYGQGRTITNSFQTNGVLLDDSWCAFLARHNFLVGLSLDGPADIHDRYRPTAGGQPSHALVMRGLRLLQKHGVRHNVLACVNRRSAREPLRVYEFLREAGVSFIQFIPIVERLAGQREGVHGLTLHGPGIGADEQGTVTEWSVLPEDYGTFLTSIFDVWRKRDVGKIFVMNVEWALANLLGRPGGVCHHMPACGRSVVVEHTGDVYACDHYVYPEHRLGNILEHSFAAMVDSERQERFGRDKLERLPQTCRSCTMLKGCWGGCPKHRFIVSGGEAVNYLCAGYRRFFGHIVPYLRAMAKIMADGRPASDIMDMNLVFVTRE